MLDVPKLSIENECLTLRVCLNELNLLLFGLLANFLKRLELRVRHGMIL